MGSRQRQMAVLVGAVVSVAGLGLYTGATAEACCQAVPTGRYFGVPRPRNTLVLAYANRRDLGLRRVTPAGTPVRGRLGAWIPLEPVGRDGLFRPVRRLDVGAHYELRIDGEWWSGFSVTEDIDVSPPAFTGIRGVELRRYRRWTSADDGPGREIEIVHDRIPLDVAFLVVTVRREGVTAWPSRQVLGVQPAAGGHRGEVTLLTSACSDKYVPPPIAIGVRYCVSMAAADAAGNLAGGDVEVCDEVIECSDHSWGLGTQCPPFGERTYMPPVEVDEIALKEASLPGWFRARGWLLGPVLAVLVVLVAAVRRRFHAQRLRVSR